MPEATQGLPQALGPVGMPTPAFWGGAISASNGADVQEFPKPAYRATVPTCPRSIESVSLDAGVGPNDGAQAAAAATAEATEPNPMVLAGYPPDLGPLLEAVL